MPPEHRIANKFEPSLVPGLTFPTISQPIHAPLSFACPQDFDQRPPHRLLGALESLLSAAFTVSLLLLPVIIPALAPMRVPAGLAWLLLNLWAVSSGSCSAAAWWLGIFVTRGPFLLPASFPWAIWGCLADALFVVLTAGLAALPNMLFRLVFGRSVVERLLQLQPTMERSRPVKIAAAARVAPEAAGSRQQGVLRCVKA